MGGNWPLNNKSIRPTGLKRLCTTMPTGLCLCIWRCWFSVQVNASNSDKWGKKVNSVDYFKIKQTEKIGVGASTQKANILRKPEIQIFTLFYSSWIFSSYLERFQKSKNPHSALPRAWHMNKMTARRQGRRTDMANREKRLKKIEGRESLENEA